ncbi:MAG: TatD family hydrolase [Phycisphaerae bacterium]
MKLIDSHCHLTHKRIRKDLDAVLQRARQAGLIHIVCAAGNLPESAAACELAQTTDGLTFMSGTHPHDAKDVAADHLQQLRELAANPKHIAIGEIGLDYHYDFSPRDVQQTVFAEQLALAAKLGKPVAIHSREAWEDTARILREANIPGDNLLLHCCTEPAENVREALDMGMSISFSGAVTFKNADPLRLAAKLVPNDRLLIETDAPFMSPEPVRKMRPNEPSNVRHVCTCLADLYGMKPARLAEITSENVRRFFNLPDEQML